MKQVKNTAVLCTALAFAVVAMLALAGCGGSGTTRQSDDSSLSVSDKMMDPSAHYMLVVGNDKWGNVQGVHSDMMMLARVDSEKGEIALLTIPRDTRYKTESGSVIKANDAYSSEGIQGALKASRQITGLNVTDYIDIGFEGLEKTVDKLNGLNMNLPYAIDYNFYTKDYPDEHLDAGEQVVNGWQSMVISRARTCYEKENLDQDMMRQVLDRQMAANLIAAVLTDKASAVALATDLLPNVSTNINAQDFISWVKQLAQNDKVTVYCNSGPTTGEEDKELGIWLCDSDPASWNALVDAFTAGEDITKVNANPKCKESDIAPIRNTYTINLK